METLEAFLKVKWYKRKLVWFIGIVLLLIGAANSEEIKKNQDLSQNLIEKASTKVQNGQSEKIELPPYEKLSYGVAQNTILVSTKLQKTQLIKLIEELPKRLCNNQNACLINIYDDPGAARTDVELTDEFMDFSEAHFIGQYSKYGQSVPVKRYKENGVWVNF